MRQKHALIVDDSRTATAVLRRMLEDQGLFVETAGSAERALDYLSHARPDVIFMDHMMPGMDGFQAVRAIKNNPATATIPIMMYTSQAGDLYVGQARALGALGVLPKQIKPVEVSAVLESLNLAPEQADVPESSPPEPPDSDPPEITMPELGGVNEPADWSELHGWLAKMLEHHGQNLRTDIERSLARLLEDQANAEALPVPAAPPVTVARRSPATTALILALAGLCALFLWLHLDTQAKWQAAVEQNTALLDELDSGRDDAVEQASDLRVLLDAQQEKIDGQYTDFLTALEWTLNQSGSYGVDEIPMSDRRLEVLDGLLQRLRSINFNGTVQIESHVGDFCYVTAADGVLSEAPADLPADQCSQIGMDAQQAVEWAGRQSIAFANYLAAFNAAERDDIRIRIQNLGNSQPLYPYPPAVQGSLAGEWNRAALKNNHVRFQLLPLAPP